MAEDRDVVSPDLKAAKIRGQWYNSVLGADTGIMEHESAKKMILVQNYKGVDKQHLNSEIKQMADRFFGLDGGADCITSYDEKLSESIRRLKGFKYIIYPFTYFIQLDKTNGNVCYTVCELPQEFSNRYCTLDRAVGRSDFTLHSRVVAALNFAEVIKMLNQYFDGLIYRFTPDAFYVNVENGDVKVIIERLFYCQSVDYERRVDYLSYGGGIHILIEEYFIKFEAYTIFRLLCADNPYDGRETMMMFPLLSAQALKRINSGEFGFIFSDCGNRYSEYIGKDAFQKWKNLPASLRKLLEHELKRKPGTGIYKSSDEWLKYMRMLRDCLVFVKGQFRLCDPDVSNNVKFIKTGDYSIPIWPRKAVYWYHIGMQENLVENGVVAGVDTDGYIENYSSLSWYMTCDRLHRMIKPGEKIEPEIGMEIEIEDAVLYIVNGENPVHDNDDIGMPFDISGQTAVGDIIGVQEDIRIHERNQQGMQEGGGF